MNKKKDPQEQGEVEVKQMKKDLRLAFVEPKLTKQGDFQEITAGSFGWSFTPR